MGKNDDEEKYFFETNLKKQKTRPGPNTGMMFNVEPGLYGPEGGFGYNPSANLLVTKKKGIPMGVYLTLKSG